MKIGGTSGSWAVTLLAALALVLPHDAALSQAAPPSGVQRPVSRPMPTRPAPSRPAAQRPTPQARPQTRPAKPPANRPATLPSYPDRPAAERPNNRPNRPNRPGANRPVTLPSYPDRPQAERPPRPLPPRPLPPRPSRPVFRPYWGYHYPTGGYNFAGTIRCESFGNRFRSCRVPTRGRVVLERRHNGRCRYGNGWGYDRTRIWADNNCRATFAYGIGNYVPRYRSDNNAGVIIGSVVVAAGLAAILSRDSNDVRTRTPGGPARVEADFDAVERRARDGLRACLDRAAVDIGQTGGSRVELTGVTIDALGGQTYRYDSDIKASYPDRRYALSFSCTANGRDIEDFDFVTEE